MANNIIQIKRSPSTAQPVSLNAGELAYSNAVGGSGVLYIGDTTGTQVVPIGGVRNPGTLTANQALVANSTSGINKVYTSNLQVNYIEANGAGNTGTSGFVLFSGGAASNVYWASAGSLSINVAAQYAWTNTHSFSNTVTFNGPIVVASTLAANGTTNVGSAGYILLSGGAGANVYWAAPGTLSINTAAQFTWTNTQTFSNTITFSGAILANTINAVSYTAGVYGSAVTGLVANSSTIALGNATINATMVANATTVYFTGTAYNANNATNLGGVAAASYQLNSTLNANIASYLPAYTGVVNASSFTVGTFGSATGGSISNGTTIAIGNTTVNAVFGFLNTAGTVTYGQINGNANSSVDTVVVNYSTAANASADFAAYDSNGPSGSNFIDMGISGSGYSNTIWTINGPSDGYLYTGNTNMSIGTAAATSYLNFFTGGTLAGNERMRITAGGNVGINNTAPLHKFSVNGNSYFGSDISVNGNSSFGNVTVSGTLVVSGSLVSVNTTTMQVNDNVIEIGFNNGNLTTDIIDTGIYSPSNTGGVLVYSGIARIAASSNSTVPLYKVFGTATNPNSALTILSSSTGALQAYLLPYGVGGAFVANSTAVNITANSTVSSAIVANSLTLTTALAASYGGTGQSSYTIGDVLYASGTSALSKLSVGANGTVLQITNNLPAYGALDGGTF